MTPREEQIARETARFGDPDAALDVLQGVQRAREIVEPPPPRSFGQAVVEHAARNGLEVEFVRVLEDAQVVWLLEVRTSRGSFKFRRDPLQTWREFLGKNPDAVALGLLPPDAPRG